jgi:hypothetical protein
MISASVMNTWITKRRGVEIAATSSNKNNNNNHKFSNTNTTAIVFYVKNNLRLIKKLH